MTQKDVEKTPHLPEYWPVAYHERKKTEGTSPQAALGQLHRGHPNRPALSPDRIEAGHFTAILYL